MYEHGDRVRLKRPNGYEGSIGDICTALKQDGSWLFDVTGTGMESRGWLGYTKYAICEVDRRYLWLDSGDFELSKTVFLGGV